MTGEHFRVDLRGVVDLLSHHLYSSPRVYVRELIQNARDAIVARREIDAHVSENIDIEVDTAAGAVIVRDHGIGLTEDEMRTVLATIGASSKRQDFFRTRRQYLGQFGIGLLACFLIGDRIEVRSRSARTPDAPTLRWVGHSDGTFTIGPAAEPLPEPGTEVRVQARPDDRDWVTLRRVRVLATDFAEFLDTPVRVGTTDARTLQAVGAPGPPWLDDEIHAVQWCVFRLGFQPIARFTVELPAAGVIGVAYLADTPGRVGNRRGDRVYSRGMFVSDDNVQLVPDWAYFVRLVVETGDLALTATRESLQRSRLVDEVREQIGVQLRAGMERLALEEPAVFRRFLDVHMKGLLAMAVSDDDMLDLVIDHVPWETSEGELTYADAKRHGILLHYATTMSDFAAFAPIVRARGEVLINGAYVYGRQILGLVARRPGQRGRLQPLKPEEFVAGLPRPRADDPVATELERIARPVLEMLGIALDVRAFEPNTIPTVFVGPPVTDDTEGAADTNDPWAELLSTDDVPRTGPTLVVNAASAAVRAVPTVRNEDTRREAITGLYLVGLLSAGERLDHRHSAMLGDTLRSLIVAAGGTGGTGDATPPGADSSLH